MTDLDTGAMMHWSYRRGYHLGQIAMAPQHLPRETIQALQEQAQQAVRVWSEVKLPDVSVQIEQINGALKGIAAIHEGAAQAVALAVQTDIWQRIHEAAQLAGENLARSLSQVAQAAQQALSPAVLCGIVGVVERLPSQIRDAVVVLGVNGWYLDPELPLPALPQLAALFGTAPDAADEALANHFRERLNEIHSDLVESFPARGRVITKAFDAHRRGDYELSIPVLLAQADGICQELAAGAQLYSKRPGPKSLESYLTSLSSAALMQAVLHPLTANLPLTASEKSRGPDFGDLNRHQILHGEIADYGTEPNSLKAISLINYVAWVLRKS